MQIGNIHIGLDQIDIPAPLLYRRMCNAYIIIFAPALTGFIASLPLDVTWKHVITGGIVMTTAFAKGIEYIIGDTSCQSSPK